MSIFNTWAQYVTKVLESESALAGGVLAHGGELGTAREAIISQVLGRFLPSQYEIGTGEIIDHLGNRSKQIDIVISRNDFPSLRLASGSRVFLLESVLATIEVKSRLNSQTLLEALDNCSSVSSLFPNIVKGPMDELAKKRGLNKSAPGAWTHPDKPIETARFDLLARPQNYIFGFEGYEKSTKDLANTISQWATNKQDCALRHYPSVVAAKGCFAWRNDKPYQTESNHCLFVAKDKNPLRLLILHLLYHLTRKIPITTDMNGITPNIDIYIQQMGIPSNPEFVIGETFNKEIK